MVMHTMLLKGIALSHLNRLNIKIRNNLSRIHLLVMLLMEERWLLLLGSRRVRRRREERRKNYINYAKMKLPKSKILSSKKGLFKVNLHQLRPEMLKFNYFKH